MSDHSNCAILDKACCLFAQANLSPCLWAEAVITATNLCNLLPSSTWDFKIPYDTFFKQSVDINKLRPFGCLADVLIPEEIRKQKLLPQCEKALFLGYVNNFSTYCFLKLNSKIVCISCNNTFNETIFPFLTNNLLDQSSFLFNPFAVLPIDEPKNIENFDVFPTQEQLIGPEEIEGHLPTTQPSNKIIGNISSENILSHC
jgi:hypothetical protein